MNLTSRFLLLFILAIASLLDPLTLAALPQIQQNKLTSIADDPLLVSHTFDTFFQQSHVVKASYDEYVVILSNSNDLKKDTFASITFFGAKNGGSYLPEGVYSIDATKQSGHVNPGDINASFDFVGAWYNTTINDEAVYYQLQTGQVTVTYDVNNASHINIQVDAQGLDYLKDTPVAVDLSCAYILADDIAYDSEPREAIVYNKPIVDFKYYHYNLNNADKDTFELALSNDELVMNLDVIVDAGSELMEGEYPINSSKAAHTTVASKGLVKGVMTSSMAKILNVTGNYAPYYFVDGKLTVSYINKGTEQEEMTVSIEAKSYFHTQFNVVGVHKVLDEPYEFEPKKSTHFDLEMGQMQITKKAQVDNHVTYELLFSDKTSKTQSVIMIHSNSTADNIDAENGLYTFDNSLSVGTCELSNGMQEDGISGSFMMTDFNEKGYAQSAYFIRSAELLVSDDLKNGSGKLYELSAITYFGSTIYFEASSWIDKDIPYVAEPKINKAIEYTASEFKITKDDLKKLVYVLEMNSSQFESKLYLFPIAGSKTLDDGTYTLSFSGEANTIQKSRGGSYFEAVGTYVDDPSYVKDISQEREIYYLDAGTVQISTQESGARLFDLNMTSHFGSTVHIKYLQSTTGIETLKETDLIEYTDDAVLIHTDALVNVYSVDGKLIQSSASNSGIATLNGLSRHTVYVVMINGESYKISL